MMRRGALLWERGRSADYNFLKELALGNQKRALVTSIAVIASLVPQTHILIAVVAFIFIMANNFVAIVKAVCLY